MIAIVFPFTSHAGHAESGDGFVDEFLYGGESCSGEAVLDHFFFKLIE
jgi:hypothetical protein